MKKFIDTSLLVQIGRRIQYLREQRQRSQSEFASDLGISFRTYQNWEHGRYDPGICGLLALAKALGVDPVTLLEPAPADWVPEHRRTGRPARQKKVEAEPPPKPRGRPRKPPPQPDTQPLAPAKPKRALKKGDTQS